MLDIILRTSYQRGVANLTRIRQVNRQELILKCFESLATSLAQYTGAYHLHVLDDHSGPEFLAHLHYTLEGHAIYNHTITSLEESGFNFSAHEQFRWGRDAARDLVYFVEDDYLHAPDAISSMVEAYQVLDQVSGFNPVAISPFDSVGMYLPDRMAPTRLFYSGNRLWRGTGMTGNTVMIHSNQVREYWPLFERLALEFGRDPTVTEDSTINRLWNNSVDIAGPICLFSPIPSTAIHVAYHEPVQLTTSLNDWKSDYDAIKIKAI